MKTVITCAITGAETTKQDNPNLPVTPDEIATSAYEAYLAGASIIHLHVRDENGLATQNTSIFKETVEKIRRKCDVIIEFTTGGAVGMSLEERLQPLQLKPDMASLDCGTINFGEEYIVNTLPMMRETASLMAAQGIRPTLECFDLSHIEASLVLIKEGLLTPPFHYGLILNLPGGIRYSPETLSFLLRHLPKGSYWTVVGIGGKAHFQSILGAIVFKGFIRVGFEDNVFYEKGILAKSNAQLVERAAHLAKESGCEIAVPDDVRKMFNLRK